MSTAFRIFLLFVMLFAAVWAYHFRGNELSRWLRPTRSTAADDRVGSLVSPVDGVLGPELDLAWIRFRGEDRPRAPVESEVLDPESETQAGDAESIGSIASEDALETVDMPLDDVTEGEREGDGAEDTGSIEVVDGRSSRDVPDGSAVEAVPPETPPIEVPDPVELRESPIAYEEYGYKVRDGESLWKIAERHLGSGPRYREIIEWNSAIFSRGTDNVTAGTELRLRREVRKESLKVGPRSTDISVEENSARGTASARGITLHKVKRNENLEKIAKRYFPGNAGGVKTILEANRDTVASADRVAEGQVLKIPGAEPGQGIRTR
jgi:nucleoid-associated protein YgaU